MPGPAVSAQEKSEWGNFVIQEVVRFPGALKEEIRANYAAQSEGKLSREAIKEAGLMDFEIGLKYPKSGTPIRSRAYPRVELGDLNLSGLRRFVAFHKGI